MQEPSKSFSDAKFKVEWANRQVNDLELICKGFIEANANMSVLHYDDKTRSAGIVTNGRGIPVEIALLTGDIVRNLRGALDYCWAGLFRAAELVGKKPPTLPFADDLDGLKGTVRKSEVCAQFPAAASLLTEKLRTHADFANEGNKPLIIVNRLSNWEKHNLHTRDAPD